MALTNLPDLSIVNFTTRTRSVWAGGNITFSFDVMNVIPDSTGFDSFGTGPAGASSAYIYLSDDAGITTADTFLGSIDIPPLGASKIQQNLATVSLPLGKLSALISTLA